MSFACLFIFAAQLKYKRLNFHEQGQQEPWVMRKFMFMHFLLAIKATCGPNCLTAY